MIEIIQTYDRAEMERKDYIWRTGQYDKPEWKLRENHILRNELKRSGFLRFQKEGWEYRYICSLCNEDTAKPSLLLHMKKFHTEILKEKISYLVSIGLLDPSFLGTNCKTGYKVRELPDMECTIKV